MNERQYTLVKVIQKIEVFRDFDAGDVQRLLRVCKFRDIDAGAQVYTRWDPSEEMLILLRGRLRVVAESGDELALIHPGNPIGEMGLFTGQPRSADIIAVDDCKVILLLGAELNLLLSQAPELHLKVLRNVMLIVSRRLADANQLVEAQQREIHDLQRQLVDGDELDDDEVYVEEDGDEEDEDDDEDDD